VSNTEYRLSRRRVRTPEEEGAAVDSAEPETRPEPLAVGSQRLDQRLSPLAVDPLPTIDGWSSFDAETAELDLPELAMSPGEHSRTLTEPMPADELARALASKGMMDNAKTLPGLSGRDNALAAPALAPAPDARTASVDPMPVSSVRFGEHQLLIVHRGDTVELILPGGVRLTAPRAAAAALADALTAR